MATRNQVPRANGEGSIGTSIKKWLAGWYGTLNATTVVVSGNISAGTYTGDGSALTGIGSGTGGVINTGSTTIGADSDANGSGEIAFQTGGATKAIITNSGKLGVGTSTPATNIHSYANDPEIRAETSSAGGDSNISLKNPGKQWNIVLDGASSSFLLKDITLGLNRLIMTTAGNLGIGGVPSYQLQLFTDSAAKPSTNTWTVVSDARLKENIILADNDRCYEILKTLPLKRYTWKDEIYTPEQVEDRSKLGWIADDVEKVFSKAVGVHRFAYNQVYETITETMLDEQGKPKQSQKQSLVSEDVIEDCRSLNADQIIAAMYGAIQKLQQKVEALEQRLQGNNP